MASTSAPALDTEDPSGIPPGRVFFCLRLASRYGFADPCEPVGAVKPLALFAPLARPLRADTDGAWRGLSVPGVHVVDVRRPRPLIALLRDRGARSLAHADTRFPSRSAQYPHPLSTPEFDADSKTAITTRTSVGPPHRMQRAHDSGKTIFACPAPAGSESSDILSASTLSACGIFGCPNSPLRPVRYQTS
jgi:hypothetical protein